MVVGDDIMLEKYETLPTCHYERWDVTGLSGIAHFGRKGKGWGTPALCQLFAKYYCGWLPDGVAEQDHDGDVDVDDGDVDLAPPHESLHQKTLVTQLCNEVWGTTFTSTWRTIQTFSGGCFRLSVRFNVDKSSLETCVYLRRSGKRGLRDQYSYQEWVSYQEYYLTRLLFQVNIIQKSNSCDGNKCIIHNQ